MLKIVALNLRNILYLCITKTKTAMTTQITITLNGKKAGQLIYFTLEMLKSNFFKVIDMEFETVDQLLKAEKTGLFKIV